MKFKLVSQYRPTGDQPAAIKQITAHLNAGVQKQTLLGVTGSGKTFSMANVIERVQRPTLVISHNKTLAAQLYQEFKEFFPDNAVHYFVSYYDYYQPEAYIPQTDTYIQKDAKINDFIDRLRHSSTQALLTRKDTIVVASVSCIYGIGNPDEYMRMSITVKAKTKVKRQDFLRTLAKLQYERNEIQKLPGTFSVQGSAIEIISPTGMETTNIEFFGDAIESINGGALKQIHIFPAKHFVTEDAKLEIAMKNIKEELKGHIKKLKTHGKLLEAERLQERTMFDMEMLKNAGYCSGIENYARHIAFRQPGDPGYTLIDYFSKDALMFIDESHITVPQIRGMYNGDQARKRVLIEHGFRLPSALDNRPLKFSEFEEKIGQTVYVSATPGPYEVEEGPVVEQIIRPTGLLDPEIEVRPIKDQIKNAAEEIKIRAERGERTLVTTITKRLAEDISEYLKDRSIKAEYLHSEVKTMERPEVLRKLRQGHYDALVGINLLREGLDIPEVSLVVILDADKEGFLRNATTLIQTMGRAARHLNGQVIMYADKITNSMRIAIDTTLRRRKLQEKYNQEHNIKPHAVSKEIREWFHVKTKDDLLEEKIKLGKEKLSTVELKNELEAEMLEAATALDFERAAKIRDMIKDLKK